MQHFWVQDKRLVRQKNQHRIPALKDNLATLLRGALPRRLDRRWLCLSTKEIYERNTPIAFRGTPPLQVELIGYASHDATQLRPRQGPNPCLLGEPRHLQTPRSLLGALAAGI